jgi:hypothetical protein
MPSADDESTARVAVSTAGTGLGSAEAGTTAGLVDSSEAGNPKAGIVRIPAKSNVAIADNRICFSFIEVAATQLRSDISSETEKKYAGIAVITVFGGEAEGSRVFLARRYAMTPRRCRNAVSECVWLVLLMIR